MTLEAATGGVLEEVVVFLEILKNSLENNWKTTVPESLF